MYQIYEYKMYNDMYNWLKLYVHFNYCNIKYKDAQGLKGMHLTEQVTPCGPYMIHIL